MQFILIVAGAIGLVAGSLAAAALLCWLLWHGCRLALHPEWAAPAVLILLVIALIGKLPKSPLLDMTLTFAVIAAVPLWIAGRAWRKQRRQASNSARLQGAGSRPGEPIAATESAPSHRLYPAITACICEDRSPSRDEIHTVASRLWREGFAQRFGSQSPPESFAVRRLLLRTAKAALRGAVNR